MKRTWSEQGFEAFSRGTPGNGGQNLYVSRAGVLQRIFQFDLNRDGYLDLVFCNSQNHWEKPPAYVYPAPLAEPSRRLCLPADGAMSGAGADLNGDGYDDLILANHYNGITEELSASIYYGSPEGFGERYQQQLPAPACTSAAAGDFNGDGRADVALLCRERVRIFYQGSIGFEPHRHVDLDIRGVQLASHDLDGDGCAELLVRSANGEVTVFWGGPKGIEPAACSVVPIKPDPDSARTDEEKKYAEYVQDAAALVRVVRLARTAYVYVARRQAAYLVPVAAGSRQFGPPLVFDCHRSLSVDAGDINGDGCPDLVFACRDEDGRQERSWIYWGAAEGFSESRKTALPGERACDVAVADLDGDGRGEIVLCQGKTLDSFTTVSRVYRGVSPGVVPEPVLLLSEDARRVFVARASADPRPQVVFVNHFSRRVCGDVDISVYWGGADGFRPDRKSELPCWGAVEAMGCDIDDDGYVDLVVANCSENSVLRDPGSYIYLGGPDGFGRAPSSKLPTTRAHGACCADLNRDGYLDLVFCGFDNPDLLIFHGSKDGFDTAHPARIRLEHEGVVYKEPRWIYLADLNNDGWLDLVVPLIESDRSFVLWGGPDGFSMARCQALSVFHGACARAADLNGNGYLDLIVGGHSPSPHGPHDSFVYIYWNGPDGLREDRRTLLPATGINAMTVADFNNDGRLDLFICSYHDIRTRDIDSYIYWNRADRGFSAADRTRLFTHSASGCVAADFNDDGWTDLAIAYHKVYGDHVGFSAVWWNGPEGFDEKRVTRLPTSGPHGMTALEPGNLMDRGPEEHFVSGPFELPAGARVLGMGWDAEVPPKTWVRGQLRFATNREAIRDAPWQGPDGGGGWFGGGLPSRSGATPLDQARKPDSGASWVTRRHGATGLRQDGRWVQYRLALGSAKSCGTPRVRTVEVEYSDGGDRGNQGGIRVKP